MKASLSLVLSFLLALAFPLRAEAQCEWVKRLQQAAQNQLGGGSQEACELLLLSATEFSRSWQAVELAAVEGYRQVHDSEIRSTLQSYADQFYSVAGVESMRPQVRIIENSEPNAFATGQFVAFHSGIVHWFREPERVLMGWGLTEEEAESFLQENSRFWPGQQGLIGILAHETAHNILGHPDAWPMARACKQYLDQSARALHAWEEEISTGKKASWKRVVGQLAWGFAETFFETQQGRSQETDADRLGAWLAYRVTGDRNLVAQSLGWIAMLPEGHGWQEALCGTHPEHWARVEDAGEIARTLDRETPPRLEVGFPNVEDIAKRYKEFERAAQQEMENVERLARGELTEEERAVQRVIEIETKPKGARIRVDGKEVGSAPLRVELGLGPHEFEAETAEKQSVKKTIIIFVEVPKKVRIDVK